MLASKQSEALVIKGSSKQAVASARVRTQLLIDGVISSCMLDYTHFVSIPLANPQTAAKLQDFQTKVGLPRWRCCRLALPRGRFLALCSLCMLFAQSTPVAQQHLLHRCQWLTDGAGPAVRVTPEHMVQVLAQPDAAQQGFDPSIFINPARLHLTLLMLKLYSDEARHKAAQTLQGMQAQVGRASRRRTAAAALPAVAAAAAAAAAALPAVAAVAAVAAAALAAVAPVAAETAGHKCLQRGLHGQSRAHLAVWPECIHLLGASATWLALARAGAAAAGWRAAAALTERPGLHVR